jgi:DNA adenine methylase
MVAKSFIKWLGGKSEITKHIFSMSPNSNYKRFIEPFAGSMVVSLNCDIQHMIINDYNPDLVNVYRCVKNSHVKLLKECKGLFTKQNNSAESYKNFRNEFNGCSEQNVRKAALFIYLNRHGFNGLCRYNAKGEFNVSFGKYNTVNVPVDTIAAANYSMKSKKVQIYNSSFEKIMNMAKDGDLVYCDPPYDTFQNSDGSKNFANYVPKCFDIKEQIELAELAKKASDRGATVIISNHNTFFINRLYRSLGAKIKSIEVKRSISCKVESRKKASEVLAVFGR